jgi:RNA polymerase sigma factor (sigma-70 family)
MIASPLTPAQRELVELARPTVDVLARRRHRRAPGIAIDELRSIGHAKLVEIIPHYDPELGDLDAFVAPYIQGAMLDFIASTLKIHRRERSIAGALEPGQPLGEETYEQVLAATDEADKARVIESLELPIAGAYIATAFATEGEDNVLDKIQMARGHAALRRFASELTQVQRAIFDRCYRDGWSAEAIANEVGIPRRTVSRTLENLRAEATKKLLEENVVVPR